MADWVRTPGLFYSKVFRFSTLEEREVFLGGVMGAETLAPLAGALAALDFFHELHINFGDVDSDTGESWVRIDIAFMPRPGSSWRVVPPDGIEQSPED